ncbi:phosphodiester glycosidase family protein [Pedobacter sp. JCM 36344]|uniref:phosphodiester glycosidase family protein n=1 Tax=Pedobacter sp. JCM 36344 TaxID=3374280 RepID=UPI0039789468
MFRNILLLLIFLGVFQHGYAQDLDSITFVKTKWTKKAIKANSKLITHHFNDQNLFGSNQNISYIEVKNKKRSAVFVIGQELKILKPTSAFGLESNALAAINGTFFDVKNGGSVDLIKVDGSVVTQNRLGQGGNRSAHQQAAILITDGKLNIKKWDGSTDWEVKERADNMMVTGPLMSINNMETFLDSGSFSVTRHPRTAVGLKPGGRVILLTVDGRNDNSSGMSLFELRKIMRWLGCTSSINLDGGGSSTLWVAGEGENGVVNYPTDNKKWDHTGERNVANTILLKTKR